MHMYALHLHIYIASKSHIVIEREAFIANSWYQNERYLSIKYVLYAQLVVRCQLRDLDVVAVHVEGIIGIAPDRQGDAWRG